MVKVTASEVNKLRKTTGAGMMDCKKALVEANGDFDSAIEILRKKGQKVAAKRADRESSEGVAIAISNEENTTAVGIVLACETDFVGKNADFVELAHKIAETGLTCNSKEDLLKASLGEMSVEEKLIEQTGVIGEKIQINDFARIDANYVGTYIHAGNKISSLVGSSSLTPNSLNSFEALNETTFLSEMTVSFLVLGFLPILKFLFKILNVPKPDIFNLPSLLRPSIIISKIWSKIKKDIL